MSAVCLLFTSTYKNTLQHSVGPWSIAVEKALVLRGSGGTAYLAAGPPDGANEATSPTQVNLPEKCC